MWMTNTRACGHAGEYSVTGPKRKPESRPRVFRPEGEAELTVRLAIKGGRLCLWSPYNTDFKELIKRKGFRWDVKGHAWYRSCVSAGIESAADLAAETVNMLVSEGFAVRVEDVDIIRKVDTGEWASENTRIIAYSEQYEDFILPARGNDDEYMDLARAMPGAHERYVSPFGDSLTVPETEWDAVAELAEAAGCALTGQARERLKELSEVEETVLTPKQPEAPKGLDKSVLRQEADLSDLIDD